ncbi:hypothetical protein Tco_1117105 [Tanacetum coccineum]
MWSSIPELLMQCIKLNHVSICYDDDAKKQRTIQVTELHDLPKPKGLPVEIIRILGLESTTTDIVNKMKWCQEIKTGSELGGKNGMFKTLICANRESNFQERRMERWNLSRGAG